MSDEAFKSSLVTKIVLLSFGCVTPFLLLEVLLRFLPVHSALRTAPLNAENPIVRFKPNAQVTFSKGWNFKIVTDRKINNDGFFNDQDYSSSPHRPLLGVIGDSYIQASMVSYSDTVYGRLAATLGTNGTVFSFGMDGAQLSRYAAWTKYAGETYHPDMLVFLIIANDFDESIYTENGTEPGYFYAHNPDGTYELKRRDYKRSAIRVAMSHSALCRYLFYNCEIAGVVSRLRNPRVEHVGNVTRYKNKEIVNESKRMIPEFMKDIQRYSKLPPERILFLIDGRRPELYSPERLASDQGSFFEEMRKTFVNEAERLHIEAIDLEPVFAKGYQQEGQRFEWEFEQHWNGIGHKVAAEAVQKSATFARVFGERK